jgi:hypothetical protein
VTGTNTWTRAREQILQLCRGDADARTLRLDVLAVLRRVIEFDAYVWLVTDPETSVGSAPLADVPCLPELPQLIRLKYLTTVNRWTSMITPVASLCQATGGDLARSLIWRDLLCRYEIGDVATSVYRDRFGCWAFLDLWRMQKAPPFAAAELEFLHSIAGPLTTALRQSQAAAFAASRVGEQASAGPVVLLLSPVLEVRAQTPQTQRYLRLLIPPDAASQAPVPAGAYNVGAQLLAREAGVDGNPPLARVHLGGGHWLTLRTRHRRQHRDHRFRQSRLVVRPGLRTEFPRDRATGPRRRRRSDPGHRPTDVRDRAHRPGSPQIDLRQNGHPHSADPACTRPRDLGVSAPTGW